MSNRRPIDIIGDTAVVTLTDGRVSIIDASDVELVDVGNWHLHKCGGRLYAGRVVRGKTRRMVHMHKLIMGGGYDQHVDHIDGDGLNNCRSNLRLGRRQDNMRNVGANGHNRSGRKGVHWCAVASKWRAQIRTDEGRLSLGVFATIDEAAAAYEAAALLHHGEFARLDHNTRTGEKRSSSAANG